MIEAVTLRNHQVLDYRDQNPILDKKTHSALGRYFRDILGGDSFENRWKIDDFPEMTIITQTHMGDYEPNTVRGVLFIPKPSKSTGMPNMITAIGCPSDLPLTTAEISYIPITFPKGVVDPERTFYRLFRATFANTLRLPPHIVIADIMNFASRGGTPLDDSFMQDYHRKTDIFSVEVDLKTHLPRPVTLPDEVGEITVRQRTQTWDIGYQGKVFPLQESFQVMS